MIRFKLHIVMAQKRIFKISELAELTKKYHKGGINRITLAKLRDGRVDRIDMFLLDVLCKSLKCSLSDLMEFEDTNQSPHKKRPSRQKKRLSTPAL